MSFVDPVDVQREEIRPAVAAGEQKIRKLFSRASRVLAAGEVLVPEGSSHDYVYRMRSGWTARARTISDGRTQYILTFLPGDLFAVKSMFVREHPDRIEALSNAVVEQIDRRELMRAYKEDSDIAMRCTWQVVEEERRLHNWVVGLGRGSVQERIASLILQFRSRLALAGVIAIDALTFDVPMTQQQLADHLGVSLVHFNKSLRRIRDAGALAVHGRTFEMLDWPALVAMAEPVLDPMEASSEHFTGSAARAK